MSQCNGVEAGNHPLNVLQLHLLVLTPVFSNAFVKVLMANIYLIFNSLFFWGKNWEWTQFDCCSMILAGWDGFEPSQISCTSLIIKTLPLKGLGLIKIFSFCSEKTSQSVIQCFSIRLGARWVERPLNLERFN